MELEVIVAIAVGALTLLVVLFLLFNKRSGGGSTVLVMGGRSCGKTLMYTQLVHGVFKDTLMSLMQNEGVLKLVDGKTVNIPLIDLPGHDRLRQINLDKYGPQAKAVIFVVDSSTFTKDLKDTAEYLYNILTDKSLASRRVPILIACNKQDLSLQAKSASVIQEKLEAELNLVRKSQSGSLEGTDGSSERRILGKLSSDFTFSQLEPQKITFVECSSLLSDSGDDGVDLAAVKEWISTL